jgi:hypothetical protein
MAIIACVLHKSPLYWVLMDVVAMMGEILRVAQTMVRKSSLPDFPSMKSQAKCAGVASLDELDSAFQGDAFRGD